LTPAVISVSQPVAPRGQIEPTDETEGDQEPATIAPPVVAVVVAHEPTPWLDECLRSLTSQDYPNLSILVIENAGEVAHKEKDRARSPVGVGATSSPSDSAPAHDDGITPRVAAIDPDVYVHRLDGNSGFGPAANQVLELVEGAAFFAFCHDDVALAPTAIRAMVEEAFRSNAGITTPKVVKWDDPTRLLYVGETADKTGVRAAIVERGELDQEQHDAVRDVFCAPGGCTLVRADLFAVLGGFDPAMELLGEDLDLSWRAQVAGARVVAVPAAVVRHVEASDGPRPIPDHRLEVHRHRIRTLLTCYGPFHLIRVLPQAIVVAVGSIVYSLLTGRTRRAGDIASAWRWNLKRLGEIRANRRQLAGIRQLPDSEVRTLQVGGIAQLGHFARSPVGGEDEVLSPMATGRDFAGSLRSGPLRTAAIVWACVLFVLVAGSRQLLFGHIPAFADFPDYPSHPWTLFTQWVSGWRNAGLGSQGAAPTAFALLGGLGVVFLGAMSALRKFLFLVLLPIGVAGGWRLSRGTGSVLARLVALVTFVAIPLPYDAMARGRWGGLLLWSAAPWLVLALARRVDASMFDRPGSRARSATHTIIGLGIALAIVAAFEPIVLAVVLVIAVGFLIGGLVLGQIRHILQPLAVAAAAVAVAIVLHLPWSLDFVRSGRQWWAFGGVQPASRLSLSDLLQFHTGPTGGSGWGWAFIVVAALPLFIGREWRFAWAARAWMIALACWAVAWVGQQSWFGRAVGPPEAFLAPAAAALSLSAGLGLAAFQLDLPGYRFGWRQAASVVAAAALLVGMVPVLVASTDGRWKGPEEGFDSVLGFVNDDRATVGPYRVAWLGDPAVLPLAGWKLDDGIAYASTDQGLPTVENRWPGSSTGATSLLGEAFHLAEQRETSRLGRLLAPMGVRYIVVQTAAAPEDDSPQSPTPAIDRSLAEQLDLQQVLADPQVQVYRNVAWAPSRTTLSPSAAEAAKGGPFFDVVAGVDLTGSPSMLTDHERYTTASGNTGAAANLYVASAANSNWSLDVDGRSAPRTEAFGWANAFAIDRGGSAKLSFKTSVQRYWLLALQVVLWVGALVLLRRTRRKSRAAT
jgi:GT2 family glycosyltransferase